MGIWGLARRARRAVCAGGSLELARGATPGVVARMAQVAVVALTLHSIGPATGALAAPLPCARAPDLSALAHGPVSCACSPEAASVGAVWGEGTYMEDSATCRAALHAGVIAAEGGVVTVVEAVGAPAYGGSTRNGVVSEGWGSGPRGFRFALPGELSPQLIAASSARCPTKLPSNPEVVRLSCTCPTASGQPAAGVWGTMLYTADSTLCAAALHAGAIDRSGGTVTVVTAPGLDAYQGSVRNGVASGGASQWHSSFRFLEGPALGPNHCHGATERGAARDLRTCDEVTPSVRAGGRRLHAEDAATCLPPCARAP